MGTLHAADDMSAQNNPSDLPVTENNDVEHQIVHVQLRPGSQLLGKCLGHLERVIGNHDQVDIEIVGYARESHQYLLTLAVDLGPRDQIAKFSPAAVAGYGFVSDVFVEMFDFLPQYTSAPTEIERNNATGLSSQIATASASIPQAKAQ